MNTKEIALIIIFVALTVAWDPVKIPSVYLPGVYYRFCEIPILAAFLLFGPKVGISVAILNVPAEVMLFPAPTVIIGVPFVFMLTMAMLLGTYFASGLLKRRTLQAPNRGITPLKYFTAFGALFRTAVAPFVVGFLYRFVLPVLNINLSDMQVVALLPAFTLYALTFSLYTIPIGYIIARTVSRNLKVGNQL